MSAPYNCKTEEVVCAAPLACGGRCQLCCSGDICRWAGSLFNARILNTSHSGAREFSNAWSPCLVPSTICKGLIRVKLSRWAWPYEGQPTLQLQKFGLRLSRADAVERIACEMPGTYRSRRSAWAATTSGMLALSKMRSREFFNSICQKPTFVRIRSIEGTCPAPDRW